MEKANLKQYIKGKTKVYARSWDDLSQEEKDLRTKPTWGKVQGQIDALISSTDLQVAVPDHPKRQELLDYRQALRDLPQTYDKPEDVVWPDNPLEG